MHIDGLDDENEEIMVCNAEKIESHYGEKPSWCPLKPLPEKKPNKWIPVSERLPENHNQEVLISLKWGIDIGWYSDGEWHSEWINHYDDGNVLAWMPLPKPYVEETAKQGETE